MKVLGAVGGSLRKSKKMTLRAVKLLWPFLFMLTGHIVFMFTLLYSNEQKSFATIKPNVSFEAPRRHFPLILCKHQLCCPSFRSLSANSAKQKIKVKYFPLCLLELFLRRPFVFIVIWRRFTFMPATWVWLTEFLWVFYIRQALKIAFWLIFRVKDSIRIQENSHVKKIYSMLLHCFKP